MRIILEVLWWFCNWLSRCFIIAIPHSRYAYQEPLICFIAFIVRRYFDRNISDMVASAPAPCVAKNSASILFDMWNVIASASTLQCWRRESKYDYIFLSIMKQCISCYMSIRIFHFHTVVYSRKHVTCETDLHGMYLYIPHSSALSMKNLIANCFVDNLISFFWCTESH